MATKHTSSITTIKVALDWTPNTNHVGFYVALADGLYAEAGLEVVLRAPDEPECNGLTPGRQVAAGLATFAISPSESAVSFATTEPGKPKLVAVAALLQGSTSAICTLKSSGIDSPAKLEGKRYASYGGRFEDAIVAAMVTNAGGDGTKVNFHMLEHHGYDEKESMGAGSVVASHLEHGVSDSTWIFEHWEGELAKRAGQELNYFRLDDFAIPYGYAPVLLAQSETVSLDSTKAFLEATAEGWCRAAADPAKAAAALCACGHPSLSDAAFVKASAVALKDAILTADGKWGVMEEGRWVEFVDFLAAQNILTDRDGKEIPREAVDAAALFTNSALP